nr:MAG TPA: hypothetical protein [Caudoviricetes sp.]
MTARELQDILLDLEIRHGNAEVCVRGSMEIFDVTDVDFSGGMINIVIDDEVTGDNNLRN